MIIVIRHSSGYLASYADVDALVRLPGPPNQVAVMRGDEQVTVVSLHDARVESVLPDERPS